MRVRILGVCVCRIVCILQKPLFHENNYNQVKTQIVLIQKRLEKIGLEREIAGRGILADRKQYDRISKELQKAEERAEKSETLKEEKRKEKEQEKEERRQEKDAEKAKRKEENKTKSFREKVSERIHRVKEFYEKIQTAKKIWEAKATGRALKHLKVEIFNLLNHLKPKKIIGSIEFGLEDPANTALLYGNIAPVAEAFSKGKLVMTPEFYNQGIRIDLLIKGRIFIGYMLLLFSRLYFDRDIHRVVKVIRRYFNG